MLTPEAEQDCRPRSRVIRDLDLMLPRILAHGSTP